MTGNVRILAMTTDLGDVGPLKGMIGSLPDEVLLEMFRFYVDGEDVETWLTLVHVCRRWRSVVFASPHRLNLRLLFKGETPVMEMLTIWPEFPIVISPSPTFWKLETPQVEIADNVIAALDHRDRVCHITFTAISFPSSKLERLVAMMQYPFPELTHLHLQFWFADGTAAVIPDSFLGGSAPHLRTLLLTDIVFPALPKLLLSTGNLVKLSLLYIPNAGYISPEVMATALSSLARLETFDLGFLSPRSRPPRESRRPPRIAPAVLPALTRFSFRGVSEYVEDFVSRIDTPQLNFVYITFFNQLIFYISQLPHFANRVRKFEVLDQADVTFWDKSAEVVLSMKTGTVRHRRLVLKIPCTEADWQLSSLAQVCSLSLPPFSTLENLRIDNSLPSGQDDMEHSQWLELLYPFTTVKHLYLREEVWLHVAIAMRELDGESITQVLPALQNLSIKGLQPSGPTWDAVESFVSTRQRFGCPIAVHRREESDTE